MPSTRQSLHITVGTPRPARRRQYFAAISASIGALTVGSIIGYASPATSQLRQPEINNSSEIINSTYATQCVETTFHSPRDFILCSYESVASFFMATTTDQKMLPSESVTLSSSQLSWFSSAFSIGALIGGAFAGVLIQHAGRKGGMLLSVAPCIAGWLALGFGRSFWALVTGRTLTGMFTGITCVAVNTYIGEISSSDIRGMLGTSFQLMLGTGIVYSYSFGALVWWDDLAFICCVPPAVFFVLVFFNPETPAFLVTKGRKEKAEETLQQLRGRSWDVLPELKLLEEAAAEAKQHKMKMSDLCSSHVARPLVIVLGLMAFQQLCGINAFVFNLDTIFKSAGSGLSSEVSSILCALVQTLATFISFFLVETAGRKLLLVISAVVMGLSHACVGLFFYLLETDEAWTQQYLSWLPLLAVMVFQVAFSAGYGPVPWVMMSELFPPRIRETASSLATVTNWTASFFVIFSFEPLQASLGSYGFYWLFACICVVATIFSATVVVETKGKTFEEIGEIFSSKNRLSSSSDTEARY
ncbi:facilitated trehalose transporter Tret1 [Hyalella azteca]|uniref:Facilitated trehalose transporter Tret1 n=1 Tax=Hyalella azteca TaxID=294128 RepID=A0A8B7N3P1_HYAAZ|nr:facilitated trehalose transporter Tret1 [Hyalella azteca]